MVDDIGREGLCHSIKGAGGTMGDRANAVGKIHDYRGLGLRTNSQQKERV